MSNIYDVIKSAYKRNNNVSKKDNPPFYELSTMLSQEDVLGIVTNFYDRVFNDEESWFRRSFTDITYKQHAIHAQTAMWLACFGYGSRFYHGGDYRLNFHHCRASQVMNERGMVRWLMHMRAAVDEQLPKVFDGDAKRVDRVKQSLNTFFRVAMDKYGDEFKFGLGKYYDATWEEYVKDHPHHAEHPPKVDLSGVGIDALEAMSCRQLRQAMNDNNIDTTGLLEKQEFIDKIVSQQQVEGACSQ